MEIAALPRCAAPAPTRCDERARRIGRVKFQVLELPAEPETVPAAESFSPSPGGPYRALRAFLSRVIGRLAAARP